MKKSFQTLSIAATIIVFSCGIQNVEILGPIKNDVSEVSTNSSSLKNEPDPRLIDPAIQGLYKVDGRDIASKLQYRPSGRTASCTIDKTDLAKTMVRLNGPSGVN